MEIVVVTAEMSPFVKASTTAEVCASLPKALRVLGHKVTVVSLLYGFVDLGAYSLARRLATINVPMGENTLRAEVYESRLPSGVAVTLLNARGLTDRERVFGEPDDDKRFAFLARATVEWLKTLQRLPDVIHLHDGPTGLLPAYLRLAAEEDQRLEQIKTVLTIHNTSRDVLFDLGHINALGLPSSMRANSERDGKGSMLKLGAVYADKVALVSSSAYKAMLPSDVTQLGSLAPVGATLRVRKRHVVEVANALDFSVWNPTTDPALIARFDPQDSRPKARCKHDVLGILGLQQKQERPLLLVYGGLTKHSGADLLLQCAPQLMRQDVALVVLGKGEPEYEQGFAELAKRFSDRVVFRQEYDDGLVHKAFAGADFLVNLGTEESDSLSVLYALRYGASVIARATGNVVDVVVDCDAQVESGNGFLVFNANADEVFSTITRALSVYRKPEWMAKVRSRALRKDVSWDRSARIYHDLYGAITERATTVER